MKKIVFSISVFTALFMVTHVFAQSTEQALRFSRHNFSTATARSAGLSGAFTSLGADPITMSLNPAGLGMYQSSEISFSVGGRIGESTSSYSTGATNFNQSVFRANISSFAIIMHSGKGTIGFGYNRLADFNRRSFIAGEFEEVSMGDMFVEQLDGISSANIGIPNNDIYRAFRNHEPALWGAILGFQTDFVGRYYDDVDGIYVDGIYTLSPALEPGDRVEQQYNRSTSGSIDEYVISGAYNFGDVFFIGGTLGMQSIRYRQSDRYIEKIDLDHRIGSMDNFTYNQNLNMSGGGINLKLGITVRPLNWIRIGAAYHSPTWTTIEEDSYQDFTLFDFELSGAQFSDTPILNNRYTMSSPSRVMAGASFILARTIIFSMDYERAWYNRMRYTSDIQVRGFRPEMIPNAIDNYPNLSDNVDRFNSVNLNDMIRGNYTHTESVRVGAEMQPIRGLFLRAGAAFTTSPFANPMKGATNNYVGEIMQYSAGIGYRAPYFRIDAAYVNSTTEALPSKFVNYTALDDHRVVSKGTIYNKLTDHNLIITLGWRF